MTALKHSGKFEFKHLATGETLRVEAIDGWTAWARLGEMKRETGTGFRDDWMILNVCGSCDAASGYAYCSQACHDAAWARFQKVDAIHAAVARDGLLRHPKHPAYAFYREKILSDAHPQTKAYQEAHFATRDGHTLALRCVSNYFGSLISPNDLEGV